MDEESSCVGVAEMELMINKQVRNQEGDERKHQGGENKQREEINRATTTKRINDNNEIK